jgi:2-iminobutanoate/2-iminopropanoate deaminase
MTKELIQPSEAPAPAGAYSLGLRVGDFIFLSGQLPIDPDRGSIVADNNVDQIDQVLKSVKTILADAGASMADVVKTTVHMRDMAFFPDFNRTYMAHFPDPRPVRTTVGSQLGEGVMIEIDVIAYVGDV